MKHFISLVFALFIAIICACAQSVTIQFNSGLTYYAHIMSISDTAIVVQSNNSNAQITLVPERVNTIKLKNGDTYIPENGIFVLHSGQEMRDKANQYEEARMVDPNYVIGKALKSTGGACLGLGIPAAIAGAILVGVGSKEVTMNAKMSPKELVDAADEVRMRGNCKTAGYVLLPFGASLTIVGIPLSIKGKKIMELKVNYTGNGAGLALAW